MLTFLPDVFAPDETGAVRPAAEEKKKRRVPAAETPAEEAPEIESRRSCAAEDTAKKAKRRARPAEGRHVRKCCGRRRKAPVYYNKGMNFF